MTAGSSRRYSVLILFIALLLVLVISYILYDIYNTRGLSLEFASTLASLSLVLVTMWYAQSTYRILEKTERQTKATRATYAPKLDTDYEWGDDTLYLEVSNRGLGVAKDIRLIVDVFTTYEGIESLGEKYRYVAHFGKSLPPEKSLTDENTHEIRIEPTFFLDTADITVREYIRNHGAEYHLALIEGGIIEEDTLGYLVDYFEDKGDGGSESFPTETGDIFDLVEKEKSSDSRRKILTISAQVVYRDVVGDKQYTTEMFDAHSIMPDLSSYSEGIRPAYFPPTSSGLRLKFGRFFMDKAKETMPDIYVTYPFEEDHEVVVKDS